MAHVGSRLVLALPFLVGIAHGQCLGSEARIHATCKVEVVTAAACSTVRAEIEARVSGTLSGAYTDPHNNGTYRLQSAKGLQMTRTTNNGKYTDKLAFNLIDRYDGRCSLYGCSESQVTSVLDFSTNCCNLRMLYCGEEHGCRKIESELGAGEVHVDKSFGAGEDWNACFAIPTPPPSAASTYV